MGSIRIAATAALFAAAAVGLAGPAAADLTDGTYEKTYLFDGRTQTVVFTSCGAGCKRAETPGAPSAEYHLAGNIWTHTLESGAVATIDNDSLTGAFSSSGLTSGEFKLVKTN